MTSQVTWVRRQPLATAELSGYEEELTLHVGGLHTPSGEYRTWFGPDLATGDRIGIMIIQSEEIDTHDEAKTFDPAEHTDHLKAYVRKQAAEWGWTLSESSGGS